MPKEIVHCSQCGKELKRWKINPNTKRPIENFFCDNACKGKWQTEQREALGFTKEWLYEEYIIKKKSTYEIAKEIGRDPKRVYEWIVNYGFETRPRGHNHDQNLIKDGSPFRGKKHKEETKQLFRELRIKDGHVPYLKDGKHWLHHDGAVSPNYKGGITPDRQAFYSSEEWSDAVKGVWKRDNAVCQRCGKKHNSKEARGTFHIHHIVSFQYKPLRASVDNLVLLCRPCHLWVHSRENKEKDFIKEIPSTNEI